MLLPLDSGLGVYEFERGRVEPVGPVPASELTVARISDDGVHLGVIDQKGKRATAFRIGSAGLERIAPLVTLPRGVSTRVIAMSGSTLYAATGPTIRVLVAGRWEREMPLPAPCGGPGKSIDELLIDGAQLIAVDDLIFPKFFVRFPLSGPLDENRAEVLKMPVHNSYEQVRFAALGEQWVVVISRGDNRGQVREYLSLFDRRTLREHASVGRGLGEAGPWTGAAFAQGDLLFLGCGPSGIGLMRLDGVHPEERHATSPETVLSPVNDRPIPPIRVHDLGAPVTGVVAVPGESGCFALLPEGRYRWCDADEFWLRFF